MSRGIYRVFLVRFEYNSLHLILLILDFLDHRYDIKMSGP